VVDGARSRRASAHYWARELTKLGHKVRLIEVLVARAGDAEKDASTDRIPTSPRDHDGGASSSGGGPQKSAGERSAH